MIYSILTHSIKSIWISQVSSSQGKVIASCVICQTQEGQAFHHIEISIMTYEVGHLEGDPQSQV